MFFYFSLDYFVLVLFAIVVLGLVLPYYAKRLAGKNVSETTYFVSSVNTVDTDATKLDNFVALAV